MTKQPETATLNVCIMVDQEGDYAVGRDHDEMRDAWENQTGSTPTSSAVYEMALTVPLPNNIVRVSATLPDAPAPAAGSIILTVKAK